MSTWDSGEAPPNLRMGLFAWLRVFLRGVPLALLVFGGLAVLLLVRLVERPIHGYDRPWTPHITQVVCRTSFFLLGIKFRSEGQPMTERGAVVSNHCSWLDIFSLNARKRVYFVSKSEVARWPGIGWLARSTGTVFIDRDPRQARAQKVLFEKRLLAGHKLLFFPEGTSSDGIRILPFKSTLFAAFFTPELRDVLYVQPVTLSYQSPDNADPRFYGWWGDMEFAPHLLQTLAASPQGQITVTYHGPLKVSEFDSRKDLASACEKIVRSGLKLSPEAQAKLSAQR
ncbi:lyso-ornithine lipid acyltransferase [Litoreibacter halocynthiae]|uniref:Lyso-ornithine lipid acyltransferase n=1 Tax=Litoreibacter halocynthiae TaxID=1242689 RepID=A0A4R7LNS7_9RHOB|nr:lysophospholipid acyltransferase family protein [Litoreibacter halocynthiae]TDT77708.1 lyso-ornithine lipid acyltransferase [Litoreibacter halocynthiae]